MTDHPVFGHRYELRRTLHEGTEARLHEAVDRLRPHRPVVLKSVPGRGAASPRVRRLESEYRLLADIVHPAFPRVYDYGIQIAENRTWLAMERMPGHSLRTIGRLAPDRVVAILGDVARALSLLHARSVLHLDVKPDNVLHDEITRRTSLVDLDLAAFPEAAAGKGTPPYAAPQIMGAPGPVDERCDLFSLGVCAFELLTGEARAVAGDEEGLDPGEIAPSWLRDLVRRLTHPDAERRPRDARAVLAELSEHLGDAWLPESAVTRRARLTRPPFTGRRESLDRLLEALPPARHDRPKVPIALVEAARGFGRSRLVEAAAIDWRVSGIRVLTLDPGPGVSSTLEPVQTLLSALDVLRSGADERSPSQAPADLERSGRFDRLASRLLQLARTRRTVLCLEDIHLYDRPSREVFLHLLRRIQHEVKEEEGSVPVEAVITSDPGLAPDDLLESFLSQEAEGGGLLRIELPAFTSDETRSFVSAMAAPEVVPAALGERLHDLSGGVPLFLREVVLGGVGDRPRGGTLLGDLATSLPRDGEVPRSVEAIVRQRLAAMPAELRRVVEIVSIFPKGATSDEVAELCELPGDFTAVFEQGLLQGSLQRHHERLHLPQVASRAAVAAAMDPEDRAALSDRAADLMARAGRPQHEVAMLRLRGREPARAFDAAYAAVPRLIDSGAEEEARRLLRLLMRQGRLSPFLARWAELGLAGLLRKRGQLKPARDLLAARVKPEATTDPSALHLMARIAQREGRIEEARSILEGLLVRRIETDERDRLALHLDLGEFEFIGGNASRARRELDVVAELLRDVVPLDRFEEPAEVLEEVRAPGFPWPGESAAILARFLALLGDVARTENRHVLGLRCHLAVVKLRSRLGDLSGLARSFHGLGTIFMSVKSTELAQRYFERALTLREEVGDLEGCAATANNLGVLMRQQGRTAEAVEFFRTSLRLRKQIGHAAGEAWSYINIANVHFARRELRAARKYYGRALEVARRLGDARSQAQVLNNLGAVAHLQARFTEAIKHYREAEALDRSVGHVAGALLRRLNLAEEYARVGLWRIAERLLESVERAQRRRDADPRTRSRLSYVSGILQAERGQVDAARDAFDAAAAALDEVEDAEARAEVQAARARLELQAGHPEAAREALADCDGEDLSPEGKAWLGVVRAETDLEVRDADLERSLAALVEGERFSRRATLHDLEHRCAWARARLLIRLDHAPQALRAFESAYEALETIVAEIDDPMILHPFLRTQAVVAFVRDVEDFAATFGLGGRSRLPTGAGRVFNRLKKALFDADHVLGPEDDPGRRYEETLWRILEVSRALRSTAPIDDLLREVVDGVIDFSKAERAFLIRVDERRGVSIPLSRNVEREAIPEPMKQVSRRIIDEVLRTGRGMRLNNAMDEGSFSTTESVVNLELRSIMCSPLSTGGRVIGMLYVDNRSRIGQFRESDLELLDFFAAQVAIALENARRVRDFVRDEKIRVLGNLAGGVAHDFNNLLAAILGRAQHLSTRITDPVHRRDLETIEKAAQDGAVVVRRMQEFTRLRREGDFQVVRLRDLVEDVAEFTRARWEGESLRRGRPIQFDREVPREIFVRGNPAELREVFTNLVLNSVAAMPEGGHIRIGAEEAGERQVRISVADTGLGMSEDVRESIFDPYFTTKGSEGSGLGMSIVYGIILNHEGTIRVESAPGQGTQIFVELPREEEPADEVATVKSPAPVPEGGRILVVEDESGVRELLKDVLERAGFEVMVAPDGERALEMFRQKPSDVVLTDLGMVPMTGWEVAQAVKECDPRTAVVLLTGWGGEIDAETARSHQVDLMMAKPFDIKQLVELVRRALHLRATRPDLCAEEG